jgi:enterochelin esterase-like enzyme
MKIIKAIPFIASILFALPAFAFAQSAFAHGSKPPQAASVDKAKPDASNKKFVEQLKHSASPIINGQWATFVYRGDAREVEIVGEMTDWERRGLKFSPLAGSGIKYYSIKFPADARIEYKIIVDDQWMLDPLNPSKKDNGVGGENSYLLMPRYKATDYTRERAGVKRGRIEPLDLPADAQGRKRTARVYLPPGYDQSSARYPTVYMSDGIEYLERASANVIVDNLIAEGRMQPVILVCLAPIERNKEYWMNKEYVDWLAAKLVPMIDVKYRTMASSDARAAAGVSLGGLTSVYAAFVHPEVFGNVLGQSSAVQVNNEKVLDELSTVPRQPIKWYLEVGRYEGLIAVNRKLKATLEKQGYRPAYREVNAGHNWTHWADELAEGLSYLFAK